MYKKDRSYVRPEARRIRRSEYQMMKRAEKAYQDHQASRKKYTSPKAEVYKSADLQKSQKQQGSGRRSYRPTPKFSTSVMSAVSLLIVIGLIATVFFAYSNSQNENNAVFSYFSPSEFLTNLSRGSTGGYISRKYYPVEVYVEGSRFGAPLYRARVEVTVYYILSDTTKFNEPLYLYSNNRLTYYQRQRGEQYEFTITDGVTSNTFIENDVLILLPPVYGTIETNNQYPDTPVIKPDLPSFNDYVNVWTSIEDIDSFFQAFPSTIELLRDTWGFYVDTITGLLPWNSFVSSDQEPSDKTVVDIPWRDNDNEYIALS